MQLAAWDPHTQRNIKKIRASTTLQRSVCDKCAWQNSQCHQIFSTSCNGLHLKKDGSRTVLQCYTASGLTWSTSIGRSTSQKRHHAHEGTVQDFALTTATLLSTLSSFFPRTIRDWNNMKIDPASASSLDAFKSALSKSRSCSNY